MFIPPRLILGCLAAVFLVIPWLLDVAFLIARRGWVYYYNLVLLFLLLWAALAQAVAIAISNGSALGVLSVLPMAAAGLLVWLGVVLIGKRKTIRGYLRKGR